MLNNYKFAATGSKNFTSLVARWQVHSFSERTMDSPTSTESAVPLRRTTWALTTTLGSVTPTPRRQPTDSISLDHLPPTLLVETVYRELGESGANEEAVDDD